MTTLRAAGQEASKLFSRLSGAPCQKTRRFSPLRNANHIQNRWYRAAVCTEYGKPFQIKDLPSKELKPNQVRVEIHAAGMNYADLLLHKGLYQLKFDPPFVSGVEFAGVVTEAGEDSNLRVGTRVAGMEFQTAHAEETVVEHDKLFVVPDNMDFVHASGFIASYATALCALKYKGHMQNGETLLVISATGALGLAAADVAKNVCGATVIGAAGGPAKCEFLKERKIRTIDYNAENVKDAVKKMYPKGIDVALDSMGGDIFTDCLKSLALHGRLLSVGFTSGKFPSLPVNHLMVKNISVTGINWGAFKDYDRKFYRKVIEDAFQISKEGNINPYIGSTFKLSEINEAYAHIAKRQSIGKVVIEMR